MFSTLEELDNLIKTNGHCDGGLCAGCVITTFQIRNFGKWMCNPSHSVNVAKYALYNDQEAKELILRELDII
jgi:hypothetical protein